MGGSRPPRKSCARGLLSSLRKPARALTSWPCRPCLLSEQEGRAALQGWELVLCPAASWGRRNDRSRARLLPLGSQPGERDASPTQENLWKMPLTPAMGPPGAAAVHRLGIAGWPWKTIRASQKKRLIVTPSRGKTATPR